MKKSALLTYGNHTNAYKTAKIIMELILDFVYIIFTNKNETLLFTCTVNVGNFP